MPKAPRVFALWLAIGGLWVLIALLMVPTAICQAITGVGLSLMEPLKAKADELVAVIDE